MVQRRYQPIDGHAEDHPLVKLNKWCQTQRDAYNGTGSSSMTEPRRMKLNKIGFCGSLRGYLAGSVRGVEEVQEYERPCECPKSK